MLSLYSLVLTAGQEVGGYEDYARPVFPTEENPQEGFELPLHILTRNINLSDDFPVNLSPSSL